MAIAALVGPSPIATHICASYERYQEQFYQITRRAPNHFANANWKAMRDDVRRRLAAYPEAISEAVASLKQESVGGAVREAWRQAKHDFAQIIAGTVDEELAQTFFTSVSRRVFNVVGQAQDIEFTRDLHVADLPPINDGVFDTFYLTRQDPAVWLRRVVGRHLSHSLFADFDSDCARAGAALRRALAEQGLGPGLRIDVLAPLFYRSKAAYIIGRLHCEASAIPLVVALRRRRAGVRIDAVLTDTHDVSILFSFTRSYFHADVSNYRETIRFIKTLVPDKPVAELYDALGHNKHGKTTLYRDFVHHLNRTADLFEFARGKKGMVMLVFTLPSYELVFKVIKDRFDQPKKSTPQYVKNRYELVFQHDRAGRLIGAQEFEQLEIERRRLQPQVLETLLKEAATSVTLRNDRVVFKHVYLERRITPLDIYLREASRPAARKALLDYGKAIKDLAATNIFPGDIFLKNFGVTRHGRVVFYDYDELCLLTDCQFRRIPQARTEEDEMASEPWYYVGPNDVFPEELATFLGLPSDLEADFMAEHGDLFDVAFWHEMQALHARGELPDVYPYHGRQRFIHDGTPCRALPAPPPR